MRADEEDWEEVWGLVAEVEVFWGKLEEENSDWNEAVWGGEASLREEETVQWRKEEPQLMKLASESFAWFSVDWHCWGLMVGDLSVGEARFGVPDEEAAVGDKMEVLGVNVSVL